MEVRQARMEEVEEIVRMEREVATAPHWGKGVYRQIVAGGGVRRCLFVACLALDEGSGGPTHRGETAMNGAPERVAGFAVGRMVEDVGEVESLAVRETEQRRGVGRALLRAVMTWCLAEGAGAIELEVRAGGAAARGLYEATGFAEVGTRPGYYGDPVEDAVLMRWVSGPAEG